MNFLFSVYIFLLSLKYMKIVNTMERVKKMEGFVTILVLYYLFGFYYIFTAIIGHYLKTGRVTFHLGGHSLILSYLITSTLWIYIAYKNFKRPF